MTMTNVNLISLIVNLKSKQFYQYTCSILSERSYKSGRYKKKHNELLVDKSVFEMQKCKLNEKIYQRFEVIQTQIIIECLESVKEITALDEEIFNTLVDSIEVGTLDIQFTLKNDLKLKVERKQFLME